MQGHLGRFGFSGDEVQRTVGTLSGGERARVAMALLTLSTNNLLILDEPTNHLDVESIEVLEDAVEGYEGSVLIVSHDRAVLRDSGAQIAHSPSSNLFLGSGLFDWATAQREGVNVSLASDVGGGTSLSLRRTMLGAIVRATYSRPLTLVSIMVSQWSRSP